MRVCVCVCVYVCWCVRACVRVQVRDTYVGEIKMIDTGHVLKLDQEHLETVIPAAGGEVLVVAGKYKGKGADGPSSCSSSWLCCAREARGEGGGI